MQRLHVNLQVADLDASARFYSGLFDAEPTVRKDDYAKWMLDDPRVNFSIVARGGEPGFGHLGIEAETPEELAALRERIGALSDAGEGRVEDEGQTVCCYHRSDKTWVSDEQGIAWEAFHTSGTSDTFDNVDTFDDGYEAAPGSGETSAGCCTAGDPCGCGDDSATAATPGTGPGESAARCCA